MKIYYFIPILYIYIRSNYSLLFLQFKLLLFTQPFQRIVKTIPSSITYIYIYNTFIYFFVHFYIFSYMYKYRLNYIYCILPKIRNCLKTCEFQQIRWKILRVLFSSKYSYFDRRFNHTFRIVNICFLTCNNLQFSIRTDNDFKVQISTIRFCFIETK